MPQPEPEGENAVPAVTETNWAEQVVRPHAGALYLDALRMTLRAIAAAVIAAAAVGLSLLCAAMLARWMLVRRRLAVWEAAWRATGPQWGSLG